jgi:hypothetical protein
MIVGHLARDPHAQDFSQALFSSHSSMGIARVPR